MAVSPAGLVGLHHRRPPGDEASLSRWAGQLIDALRRHTGRRPRAAGLADRRDAIPVLKLRGWKALNVMAGRRDLAVGSASQFRAALILDMLAAAYLDAFGDVAMVAAALHVHPSTLRQRIRRGLDLDDPAQRLVTMVQLRRMLTGDGACYDPFPEAHA